MQNEANMESFKNDILKCANEFQTRYLQSVYQKESNFPIRTASEEPTVKSNENTLFIESNPKNDIMVELENIKQNSGYEIREEPFNDLSKTLSLLSSDQSLTDIDPFMDTGSSFASGQSTFSNRSFMIDVTSFASICSSSSNLNSKPFLKAEAGREKSIDTHMILKSPKIRTPSTPGNYY